MTVDDRYVLVPEKVLRLALLHYGERETVLANLASRAVSRGELEATVAEAIRSYWNGTPTVDGAARAVVLRLLGEGEPDA